MIRTLALAAMGCLGICALGGADVRNASRADSFDLSFDWDAARDPDGRNSSWQLFTTNGPPGQEQPQDSAFTRLSMRSIRRRGGGGSRRAGPGIAAAAPGGAAGGHTATR